MMTRLRLVRDVLRSPAVTPVHRLALVVALLTTLGLAGLAASERSRDTFPHRTHERLFPVCEGCHAGVVSGTAADAFPEPSDCTRCHDGQRAKKVEWRPRLSPPSNLEFSHARHLDAAKRVDEQIACQACHATGESPSRMDVAGPKPDLCIRCHEHAAEDHLARTALCSRCHVPLASAPRLPRERVARFPRPSWHDDAHFLTKHAQDARTKAVSCKVCHARETCERCHANAERVPEIVALGRDARVAALERGREATYPEPASHEADDWQRTHGRDATASAASCANCHTRPSCTGCHMAATGGSGAIIASLPALQSGSAPGVSPSRTTSAVHPADVKARHGSMAAAGAMECAQCHAPEQCAACHAGSDSRAFHVANFVERHALETFAGGSDCQSCHSTETFCRACHARNGLASGGRMTAAFHTGQPMWVLSHGQAARQGMDACASCHRQNDCVQCHSAGGGWGVNPHGRGFDANRAASRSGASCRLCHLGNPIGRN